jgi:hypothetical protein
MIAPNHWLEPFDFSQDKLHGGAARCFMMNQLKRNP